MLKKSDQIWNRESEKERKVGRNRLEHFVKANQKQLLEGLTSGLLVQNCSCD